MPASRRGDRFRAPIPTARAIPARIQALRNPGPRKTANPKRNPHPKVLTRSDAIQRVVRCSLTIQYFVHIINAAVVLRLPAWWPCAFGAFVCGVPDEVL